jgi:hypothetical protein
MRLKLPHYWFLLDFGASRTGYASNLWEAVAASGSSLGMALNTCGMPASAARPRPVTCPLGPELEEVEKEVARSVSSTASARN